MRLKNGLKWFQYSLVVLTKLTVWPRISYFQGLKRGDWMRDHKMRWATQLVSGLPIEKIVASNWKFVIVGLSNSCKFFWMCCWSNLHMKSLEGISTMNNPVASKRRPWISRTGAERALVMLHSFYFPGFMLLHDTHPQTNWQVTAGLQSDVRPSPVNPVSFGLNQWGRVGCAKPVSMLAETYRGCIPQNCDGSRVFVQKNPWLSFVGAQRLRAQST